MSYTPSSADVGHRLRFSCTVLTSSRGTTRYVVTQPCIPLPDGPAPRIWNLVSQQQQGLELESQSSVIVVSSSLIAQQARLDTKFIVMTYNLMLHRPELATSFKQCPSYALTLPFRKRILQLELEQNKPDVLCLQQVDDLGDDFFFELSKNGYSGFKDFQLAQICDNSKNSDNSTVTLFNKCMLLYKRSKFTLYKSYAFKLQVELTKMLQSDMILQQLCSKHGTINCGEDAILVAVLELRDVVMSRDSDTPRDDFGKVIVVNAHLNKDLQVSLIEAYVICQLIKELSRDGAIPIVITGDFESTYNDPVYQFFKTGANPNYDLKHSFDLVSAYGTCHGSEPVYVLNDLGSTVKQATDFIFYATKQFTLRRVANMPTLQSNPQEPIRFPNPDHVSDHVSLLCELEFVAPPSSPQKK